MSSFKKVTGSVNFYGAMQLWAGLKFHAVGRLMSEESLQDKGVFSELCQSARKGSSVKKKGLTNEDSKRKTLV